MIAISFSALIVTALTHKESNDQFRNWYPEYRMIFQKILRDNCSEEYAFYLAGEKNWTKFWGIDKWEGPPGTAMLVWPCADCILIHCSEWMRANMAAAAVLLGLTPTILAALGPLVEETSTLLVIARRHVLGVCLAAGSPSIYPFRAINYKETIEDIVNPKAHLAFPAMSRKAHWIVTILEYILAACAIVNNATNSYQLGMQVCCVYAPHIPYLPLIWAFLGILAHLFGAWALWARIQVDGETPSRPFLERPHAAYHWTTSQFTFPAFIAKISILSYWSKNQVTPSAHFTRTKQKVVEETIFSVGASWWVSINIACHITGGTLTFSSLLFITVRDVLAVIARYLASLLICRMILMYELACFRVRAIDDSRSEAEAESHTEVELLPVVKGRRTYSQIVMG